MAKSAWMEHLAKFRKAHPDMPFAKVAQEAAKTYKKQCGGSALGGELQPESISGIKGDSGTNLQIKATLYGGKKSKSHKAKSHKAKSHKAKSHKRKSHKRSSSKRN